MLIGAYMDIDLCLKVLNSYKKKAKVTIKKQRAGPPTRPRKVAPAATSTKISHSSSRRLAKAQITKAVRGPKKVATDEEKD